MSRQRIVTVPTGRLPEASALNRSLKDERFPLSVDADWDNPELNGYLACTLSGEDAGFDLRRRPAAQDGSLVLSLHAGGDPREIAAAHAVLSVLSNCYGATVTEGDGATVLTPDVLRREAKRSFQALEEG